VYLCQNGKYLKGYIYIVFFFCWLKALKPWRIQKVTARTRRSGRPTLLNSGNPCGLTVVWSDEYGVQVDKSMEPGSSLDCKPLESATANTKREPACMQYVERRVLYALILLRYYVGYLLVIIENNLELCKPVARTTRSIRIGHHPSWGLHLAPSNKPPQHLVKAWALCRKDTYASVFLICICPNSM
jgi:hypothetical protein